MEKSKYSFNEVEQKLDIIQNDKGTDKYLRGDGTYAVPPSLPGITPNLTIGTVETLPSGSDATATITGDKENPVLNLGIPNGADGHTPIKGTDYWTTDDKAEIVNDVLESLPRAESEVY